MESRLLARDQIDLIWTIDRSEVHSHIYRVVDGRLLLVPAYFEVPGWDPETIEGETIRLRDCFDRGGIFHGAFDRDALVGVSIVDTKLIEAARDHQQLLYLYVSRPARGQGVGRALFGRAAETARGLGARSLYISATPTENTVDFYLHRGASLLPHPDSALFAAEPDDVHLTYPVPVGMTLRPVEDRDLDLLFVWESDPRAVQMAAFTRADPSDRSAFDAHYERVRNDPSATLRAIVDDAEFVGTVGSYTMDGHREVTYWISPARWGRGLASQALQLYLALVEPTRPIYGRVAEHNAASAKVLARAGFAEVGSDTGFAPGVGAEVVERIYRLDG